MDVASCFTEILHQEFVGAKTLFFLSIQSQINSSVLLSVMDNEFIFCPEATI